MGPQRLRQAAAAGALSVLAAVSATAAAGAQPSLSVPDASPDASSGRLPGATLIESIVSWAWWIAMLMSVVSLFIAGGAYGYFYWNSKSQQASTALKVVVGTLVGALLVGGAGVLVNTLFGFGFNAF